MALRRKKHNHSLDRKTPIEHTGFFAYMRRFLEAALLKGYSDETNRRYEAHIRRFAAWCEGRGIDQPNQVTKPILERYRRHLYYYRKTNEPTAVVYFPAPDAVLIKSFFRWLTQQNYLLYNPASELELPKPPKQLPRTILSLEQMSEIIGQPDIDTPEGLRDRTILELFYSTGLRRTELANLKEYDIDLNRGILAGAGRQRWQETACCPWAAEQKNGWTATFGTFATCSEDRR